jgi:transposase
MGKFRRKETAAQEELWVRPQEIVAGPHNAFYTKLAALLTKIGFTDTVHRLCAEHYGHGTSAGGRPPVDPAVLMRMLMVGFLEGIGSERGIASRCADSLAIRRFLGYSLTEETPDHSTFTVFRQRLPKDTFEALHTAVLRALKDYGLLKGRQLGIDSSIIEANASFSGLEHRNTEQSYQDYVRALARAAGVDADDPSAVARFDRKRAGRKTSNKEWHNPDDPDARIGRTKDGACDMIYKPEHIVDLQSGAIIAADVRPGDAGDTAGLSTRVIAAAERVEQIHDEEHGEGSSRVRALCGDKGFHESTELAIIQHATGARTVIGDASAARRRLDKMEPEQRRAVQKAARAVQSKSGKALLRARGEHIERGFAHVLDAGGLRRTHLRGRENISKRYLCGIIAFNLSLLLRKLLGVGTPRQMAARAAAALRFFYAAIESVLPGLISLRRRCDASRPKSVIFALPRPAGLRRLRISCPALQWGAFSTGS